MVSKTIQYSDGKQEIVDLPIDFAAGTILSITKKRDGGIVASFVGAPGEGYLQLESGGISGLAGDGKIRVKVDITILSACNAAKTMTLYVYGTGAPPYMASLELYGNEIADGTIETGDAQVLGTVGDVWLGISVNEGIYVRIDNAMYSIDSGATWNYTADGNCSSGSFVSDHAYGWVKKEDGVTATFASGGIEIV
ncbi:MAG: hypothetical protein BWY95_02711 [Bacteroidetes bacterium ADurb.BinA104]|nr:MAG: hypothetical protein BWY95_02711 [Bacteroidetes bacterium ADurb.BinA104]